MLGLVAGATPAYAIDPGYQGFGSTTPGGSAGAVVRVTTLADAGPGSLREAVSRGSRTVVFDVAGEILLEDHIYVGGAFVTIDGFTAPPPGITLKNRGLIIRGNRGAHDVIVRGIRVRDSSIDGIQVAYGAYNVVIDHVSIRGSADGNIDITEGSRDVTVSWSILAEPVGESKNMLVKYNPSRVTLHHNLFVRARQRNPQIRVDDAGTPATETTVDMRNNLVWDWMSYGTLVWYGAHANVVNNFYSAPSASLTVKGRALIVCEGDCDGGVPASAARAFVSGNISADQFVLDLNAAGNEPTPFPAPAVATTGACAAAHEVVAGAGVRPLDAADQGLLARISLPACAPAVALQIQDGHDDASEAASGSVRTRELALRAGRGYLLALRFVNVPLPRGAVVQSAVLGLYGVSYVTADIQVEYRAEAADDSLPLLAASWDLSRRSVTRASVADAPAAWIRGDFNVSPDLRDMVQEVIDRPGWWPGNSLTILITDDGSPRNRLFAAAEASAWEPRGAVLRLTYIVP